MLKEKSYSLFNLFVFFFVGLLLASNVFLVLGYLSISKKVEEQRGDILNIVQAYNNLVNTLQSKGVLTNEQKPE